MRKAIVFLADGFEECEALLAVDLFRVMAGESEVERIKTAICYDGR